MTLSTEEEQAIEALRGLGKKWPKTLWIFVASGSLHVMRKVDGNRVTEVDGSFDQDYVLDTIGGIDIDGGDW
jgi:hypothetical protein